MQNVNARPHTSRKTTEGVANFGWMILPHPPYSPDLALSDFNLLAPLKTAAQRFPDRNTVIAAVKIWTTSVGADVHEPDITALVHRRQKSIETGDDYVEKKCRIDVSENSA